MARIIEAEARISAIDATGNTFAEISAKVRGLASTFRSLGNVGAQNFAAMDKTVSRLQSTMRVLSPYAASAAAYEGMRGVSGLIHEAVSSTAARAHEAVRMEVSGMPASEIADAERVAAELSERYKALSQTTIMHSLRNMRAIVGTYEEAAKILDPILKLRIAAMGARPGNAAELAEDFDKLVKGMEIKGVTMDPVKFTSYMQGMAKALNVFGDTLKPYDYYQMFKYGSVGVQALSQQFMLETAPTFAQEMGGSRTGMALAMFYAKTVGDSMTLVAANELKKFGLIDMSKVQSKAGRITRLSPGAVVGWQTAAHDPYAWVNDVLLPAMARHGVTDKDHILGEIATIFGSGRQSSGALVSILATQQQRIHKDWNLVEHARGLEAADIYQSKDPFIAMDAVAEQFKNLLAVAGSPLAAPAAKALNEIASGIAALENAAKKSPLQASAGLVAGVAGAGYATWKATQAALRAFGLGGAGAPSSGGGLFWPAMGALLPLGLGADAAWEYLSGKEAAHQSGLPVDRDAIAALPWYRRGAGWIQENIFGADPNLLYPELHGGAPAATTAATPPPPVTAKVEGDAELKVNVTVEPSQDFITRIETQIHNAINAFRNSLGAPAVGTAGSTGRSMPAAAAAPR